MIDALISLVHAALVLYAIVRSAAGRFPLGLFAGLVRLLLLAMTAARGLRGAASGHAGATLAPLAAALAGPLLSFVVLFVAYGRMSNAPAAQEEELSRPFKAWIGVAVLDASAIVIALAARALAEPW